MADFTFCSNDWVDFTLVTVNYYNSHHQEVLLTRRPIGMWFPANFDHDFYGTQYHSVVVRWYYDRAEFLTELLEQLLG
jgi:hypothetical protein